MNREAIMTALFARLTSAPMVFQFTADTTTGDVTLANVSDTTGLMIGMPVMGDGLAADVTLATITPTVTVSLPAIADRSASAMRQGFQTARRRWADVNNEQDLPALYLVEGTEIHGERRSTEGAIVVLTCEIHVHTRVGADPYAIPSATLNTLIDSVESALYPTPQSFRQTLGQYGVLYCRIEGEVAKDPGLSGQIASAIIPIRIAVGQH
jgi:hypothetical protein